MKKILFLPIIAATFLASCDKVKNAYPEKATGTSTLDWSLYPDGDSAYYASQGLWPTFPANTNTFTNVLIEDFTGHRCFNCPNAANIIHTLEDQNPGRVFGAGIHTSPFGMSNFQQEELPDYPSVLYNPLAFEIGIHFGSKPGTGFLGNPNGAVNRQLNGTDNTSAPATWNSKTAVELNKPVRVNIQSHANYFASTRGSFLHVEVDKVDNNLTNQLAIVVYVCEDSLIAPQLMPDLTYNPTYVHRDILRDCIDGNAFGRVLAASDLGSNGKYYVNYTYALPSQYNVDNMHYLIYVYDKVTEEIYQVIEQHLH
ncbi:MAG: Omp28-related outer membrane protein [Fluviicola sp.]